MSAANPRFDRAFNLSLWAAGILGVAVTTLLFVVGARGAAGPLGALTVLVAFVAGMALYVRSERRRLAGGAR